MRLNDIGRRTILRWGMVLVAVLLLQSVIEAGVLRVLVGHQENQEIADQLRNECDSIADQAHDERVEAIHRIINGDIHRVHFIGWVAADGHMLAGNIAHVPKALVGSQGETRVVNVNPTNLPGVRRERTRAIACPLGDGTTLYIARDLNAAESGVHIAEQAVMMTLPFAVLIAIVFGAFMARLAARRLDSVRRLAERVMDGKLRARLPTGGSDDSFQRLCRQINLMLDRIEVLLHGVKGVGDDIAHELKTPLARMRSTLELALLREHDADALARAARRVIHDIDHSERIVSALLRIREFETDRQRQSFTEVDPADLAAEVVALYEPLAQSRGVTLKRGACVSAVVRGDPDLLFEALSNVVDNAIKFSPAGGTVDVVVAQPEPGRVALLVGDEAPAIDAAEQARIVQRFARGRAAEDRPGSGLGLSLVKAILDLHDATLNFEPRPGASGKQAVIAFPAGATGDDA